MDRGGAKAGTRREIHDEVLVGLTFVFSSILGIFLRSHVDVFFE
jgi:hypothetical protein